MATYLDESLAKLEWFEGAIPWMYLDTRGYVTVGVGLMLPDAAAAQKLPFMIGGRAATEEEIAGEYGRVEAMAMGRPAQYYRKDNGLVLEKAEIDSLLRTVLAGFEGELRAKLTGYDGFPDSAKLALLDMAYNLGPVGLLDGYPTLIAAVEAGNWAKASSSCFRHGPGAARNQWTQTMFLQNVAGALNVGGEGALRQFGYGMLGLGAAAVEWLRKKQ
jgi:GH24 family phage-related lysozyme (muramidase)